MAEKERPHVLTVDRERDVTCFYLMNEYECDYKPSENTTIIYACRD
jgi:hypothetical protein